MIRFVVLNRGGRARPQRWETFKDTNFFRVFRISRSSHEVVAVAVAAALVRLHHVVIEQPIVRHLLLLLFSLSLELLVVLLPELLGFTFASSFAFESLLLLQSQLDLF